MRPLPPSSTLFPYTTLFRSYRVVSPLTRPVLVPRSGRLIVAGRADAITPLDHARMIAQHFQAPLETFARTEEHTSELQSQFKLVCRLPLEKKKQDTTSERNI